MKRMIIESLIILSRSEKKAKKVEFDRRLTVFTSQRPDGTSINRTGKSLVLKSIFYAFGADLGKYSTNWHELNICTILKFSLNNDKYTVFRNGNSLILTGEDGQIHKFSLIKELKDFYVDFFDFHIKLLKSNSKPQENKTHYLYPGAVFMPFYIDQDLGWQGEWRSFNDIRFFKDWKKEILFYHAGIKPKRYYQLLQEQAEFDEKNKNNKFKFKTLLSIYEEQLKRNSEVLDINIKLEDFKEEIALLTSALNKQLIVKNSAKDELLSLYNEKYEIEENYHNAIAVLHEMQDDITFLNENLREEYLKCPTCGVVHENSVSNRFIMYQEVEKCKKIIEDYQERKNDLENTIIEKESEITELDQEIQVVNNILNKRRNEVTFDEVLKSKGALELLKGLSLDMSQLNVEIEQIDGKLKGISNEKRQITKDGNARQQEYSGVFNTYLSMLHVGDVDITKKRKIGDKIKSSGSDLAKAVLAELFACYYTIQRYSTSVVCPIVVDTPLQQDQGSESTQLIFDFLIDKQPTKSQVIIATTETHGKIIDGKIVNLLNERALLTSEEYSHFKEQLDEFLNLLLT